MKKLLVVSLLAATARLFAVTPAPYTEPVGFSFLIGGMGNGIMTVYAEPGDSVGQTTYDTWTESAAKAAWLRPGKSYSVNFQASGPGSYSLSFVAPAGYAVYLNGAQADMTVQNPGGGWYSHDYTLEIRPLTGRAEAGAFSGLDLGRSVTWDAGLGGLRDGRSAGRIAFREKDLAYASYPATRNRLYYTPPANVGQITTVYDGPSAQTPRQIMAPQTLVDLVDDAGGGYWLKFYTPTQGTWNGSLYTLSGSPWKTIRVESPGANQMKLTETEGVVSRVSHLSLTAGTVSTGTYQWILQEGDGTAWLRTTKHTSTAYSNPTTLATGGAVTTSGAYTMHTFTTGGILSVSSAITGLDAVIVAGGGGGGHQHAGGGGAGGLLSLSGLSVGTASYGITVGAGGAGCTWYPYTGNNGGNSSALGYTAIGGGAGTGMDQYGNDGGSGGGDGYPSGGVRGGNGTAGQGNTGSRGSSASIFNGGGGGGAGGAGSGANGGAALSTWAGTFAGGGGGGYAGGPGGGAGAGAGGYGAGYGGNAAANTGSGGGGGGNMDAFGGSGGSGVVVLRYLTPAGNNYREEFVEVRTGATTGTVVAKTKHRYENPGWGEEVTQVTANPDGGANALTTAYTYHTTSSELGNYRRVKSVTGPDGGWTSYAYHDDWNQRGQLRAQSRPWLDSPATATAAAQSVGQAATHNYAPDFSGRYRLPFQDYAWGNNLQTGQTLTAYNVNQVMNGQPYTVHTTDNYSGASAYVRTVRSIVQGNGNPDYVGKTLLVRRADGSQDSRAWHYGSYNYSTKTFTYPGDLSHWRETVWHGTSAYVAGGLLSAWDSLAIEPVYLVPNQSTMDVIIRNPAGDIVRTETHVCSGGTSFSLMIWEDFTYDSAGRLTSRVASNGATTTNTWTNGRLTSSVDPTGTETQFTYDSLGRVATTVKKGAAASGSYAAQGDITTTSTYDGANHVTQTVVSGGALSQTATAAYDLAGRVTSSVAPGGYTTTFAYASGGRIVTTTLPGGATRITEAWLDGRTKSVTGTAVVAEHYTHNIQSDGTRELVHRQVSATGPVVEYVYTDWLGRTKLRQVPSPSGTGYTDQQWLFNSAGRLYQSNQTGRAATLYVYDTMGQLVREGLDVGANGALDLASSDRITDHAWTFFSPSSGVWWKRDTTSTYATTGSGTATQLGKTETQLSGLPANRFARTDRYDIFGNVTAQFTDLNRSGKLVTTTTDAPDSTTDAVSITYNGLLMSARDTASHTTTFGYDALGRPVTSVDPRTGTTTTAYVSGTSQVYYVQDAASITQALYTYDSAGRVSSVKDALNKYAYTAYTPRGEVYRQWGDTTHPVEYAYDSQGRRTTMNTYRAGAGWTAATWPGSPGTADTTTWAYHASTGLLVSKTDAASKVVSYTYTQAGQLATRTWARGVVTTYAYSATTRELTSVSYNDGTPSLSYTFNRLGQNATVADTTGTRTLNYNLAGTLELQSEDLPSFFGSRRVTYPHATSGVIGRQTGLQIGTSGSPTADQNITYNYQADGRVSSIAGGGQTFAYGYVSNSHLIGTVTNSAASYTDTRVYDATHDWTDSRVTTISAVTKASFAYAQDNLGRITDTAKTGEVFNRYGNGTEGLKTYYGYDDRSQITSEVTKVGTSATVLTGRNDAYAWDNIGNRTSLTQNGNAATYTANALNQYTQRGVPGYIDVAGASTQSTVTVTKSGGPTDTATRHGNYFFDAYGLTNTSNAVFATLMVNDTVTTLNLLAYLAKTPEPFTYDDDGNLTRDGRWVYQYDAENRLIAQFTRGAIDDPLASDAANVAVWNSGVARQKLLHSYDYLGRRVSKLVANWDSASSTWQPALSRKFAYDGRNQIAEFDVLSTLMLVKSSFWGLDLSGTLQGAGGVGGLLMVQEGGNTYLPAYDAMGNVHAFIKASDGSLEAVYEYDAFGNTLRESGAYASSNPFRFSTKYTDVETGLVYYGLRYYSPSLGRFINQDPIAEQGGLNLYGFCGNNGVNHWDYLGNVEGDMNWVDVGGGIKVYLGSGGGSHVGVTTGYDANNPAPPISEYMGPVTYGGGSSFMGRASAAGSAAFSGGKYTVTYHTKSGVTTGSTGGQVVGFSDRAGNTATIDQTTARWEFSSGVAPTVPASALGNGALGLFLVHNDSKLGIMVTPTNSVATETAFANGITGSLADHAKLGFKHLESSDDFTLFNIPTQGFWGDVYNVSLQKLGIDTPASTALAGVLQSVTNSDGHVKWIAHSGGAAAFAQAMNYAMANGSGGLGGNSVRFDGGANNSIVTNRIAHNAGVDVTGYYYSFLDFVPNVIGGNGNPVSILLSTVALPTLFIGPPLSQHTAPTPTYSMHPGTNGPGVP